MTQHTPITLRLNPEITHQEALRAFRAYRRRQLIRAAVWKYIGVALALGFVAAGMLSESGATDKLMSLLQ